MKRVNAFLFVCFILLTCICGARASEVEDLLLKGADAQYRGDLAAAEQAFARVLQVEPQNAFALNQLGLVYAKQEKYASAFELFTKVKKPAPENTFARIWRGLLLLRENRAEEAHKEFQEVIELDPYNAGAYYFLGVIYGAEHNRSEAVKYFRKAQAVNSDDPEVHYRLAESFLGLDMPVNALLELDRALEILPDYHQAVNLVGRVRYRMGEKEEAVQAWQHVLEQDPDNNEARANLATLYHEEAYAALQKGDKTAAQRLWQQTLRIDPGNKAAEYYLRHKK